MMNFLERVLRMPRVVLTVMSLLLLAGFGAYVSLPKESFPAIDIPYFYVSVSQTGVSPRDAERLLARLAPLTRGARIDYDLRFTWQRALLAIANNNPTEASRLAAEIDRKLSNLPAGATPDELSKAVPELRGHAALLKARTSLNAGAAKGLDELVGLSRKVWRTRAYGDMWSYMMVAEGILDVAGEFDLKPYDMAALMPIVTEAGGTFTSIDGHADVWHGSALATNGQLHAAVLVELAR